MEFRHSVGLRALEADDYDNVFCHLASFKGGFDGFLIVENPCRGGDDVFVFGNGRDFHHARPQIAFQVRKTTRWLERIGDGFQNFIVEGFGCACLPRQYSVA